MEGQRSNDGPMRLLIPAYFAPGAEWRVMRDAAGGVGMVILNPASGPGEGGPGTVADDGYRDAAGALRDAGIEVLGYVDTSYGVREATTVLSEVERHRRWYDVDGVFFDQVRADGSHREYHRTLADGARARGCRRVVVNPGVVPVEDIVRSADVIAVAENDARTYLDMPVVADWTRRHPPARFAHLVYGAEDIASMTAVVARARARGAGWVFVTPLPTGRLRSGAVAPHPWAGLPGPDYWVKLLEAVAGDPSPGG
jgi:hypothetical protein